MIQEAEFTVRALLTTTVTFSPIERDAPITRQDAIDNAIGTMPDGFFTALENEGWSIEFAAEHGGHGSSE